MRRRLIRDRDFNLRSMLDMKSDFVLPIQLSTGHQIQPNRSCLSHGIVVKMNNSFLSNSEQIKCKAFISPRPQQERLIIQDFQDYPLCTGHDGKISTYCIFRASYVHFVLFWNIVFIRSYLCTPEKTNMKNEAHIYSMDHFGPVRLRHLRAGNAHT